MNQKSLYERLGGYDLSDLLVFLSTSGSKWE